MNFHGFLTASSATGLSRGRVSRLTSDNFTWCHTKTEWGYRDQCLNRSHYMNLYMTVLSPAQPVGTWVLMTKLPQSPAKKKNKKKKNTHTHTQSVIKRKKNTHTHSVIKRKKIQIKVKKNKSYKLCKLTCNAQTDRDGLKILLLLFNSHSQKKRKPPDLEQKEK